MTSSFLISELMKALNEHHSYLHIGRAADLTGSDRILYRALEMFPGLLAWGTIFGIIFASIFTPRGAAIFIIVFDLYWLIKTTYLSVHLRHNWKRLQYSLKLDWTAQLAKMRHDDIVHLVILPYYKENEEIVRRSLEAIRDSIYDKKKIMVVLAAEERAGAEALAIGKKMEAEFGAHFSAFLITVHPANTPGEIPGKGSNLSYSAEDVRKRIINPRAIDYKNIIVSAFDIDTVIYPHYFNCLTWYFLTTPEPHKASFQPVPFYNNNIWGAPALTRVSALSSTFWQMIQQERPEKLATFSSHAASFYALHQAGYWQRNIVSEDSRIFWNLYLFNNGNYATVPISYPVSMDANAAPTFWETARNIYKQYRRWGWGVENVPYIIFGFIKNKKIPLWDKVRLSVVQIEGFWSWSTSPLIILLLGWLPVIMGGEAFKETLLSYNLPIITRDIMTITMLGLIFSSVISFSILPPMPSQYGFKEKLFMVLQWTLVPFSMIAFGTIPALESQTRLLFGKYLGFWVTPKVVLDTERKKA